MDDIEQRIRHRAYELWEEDGRPEGREQDHWERARFLVGIEDNPGAGQLPNPMVEDREKGFTSPPPPTPVEPIEAIENQGEFPDRFADQGEKTAGPVRRATRGSRVEAAVTASAATLNKPRARRSPAKTDA